MDQKAAVTTDRLVVRFGDLKALDHLDLRLGKGEIYSLIGSNGSGKTTLANVLTGAVRPTQGHFQVLDQPRDRPDPRHVGYMPQEGALYGDLTVKGNLRYFASLYGVKKRSERIEDVAATVHLSNRMDSRVRTLSGGMQRRASLACALLADPEVMILDEPTVGVDPVLRAELWDTFRYMTRRGRTVLITTHYLDEAQRSDRVGLLHAGRLLAEGTPAEVLQRTKSQNLEDSFYTLLRDDQQQRRAQAHRHTAAAHPRSKRIDQLPRAETHLVSPPPPRPDHAPAASTEPAEPDEEDDA